MQENTAKTAAEWVFVAKSVAQLPDGENPALRCMARAGMAAKDVSDWVAVAKAWQQEFNDIEVARHCMMEAEKVADDSNDRIRIAKIWGEHFQDLDNAIRCMEKAEEVADYPEDYSAIEETYRTCFPNVDSAIRRLAILRIPLDVTDSDVTDGEGYFGRIPGWFNDMSTSKKQDITNLGILTEPFVSQFGIWTGECESERRQGRYAKYYRFTLSQTVYITIDLISEVDTYLYLISGDISTGKVLDENDDRPDNDAQGLLSLTDSRLRGNCSPELISLRLLHSTGARKGRSA